MLVICLAKTTIHAQSRISVSYENADFKHVLKDLLEKTDLGCMFSENCLRHSLPVTYEAKNVTLDTLLKHIFNSQPFEYRISGRNILLIFPKRVRGRVIDIQGKPIEGVIVRGESQKTQTDSKGEFILENASCDSAINFFHRQYLNYVLISPPPTFTIRLSRFK